MSLGLKVCGSSSFVLVLLISSMTSPRFNSDHSDAGHVASWAVYEGLRGVVEGVRTNGRQWQLFGCR